MGFSTSSKARKRNHGKKAIPKRRLAQAMKAPRKDPNVVVAKAATDEADAPEHVNATAAVNSLRRSSRINKPISDIYSQPSSSKNVAKATVDINHQPGSSKGVVEANVNADLGLSSPAASESESVSKVAEKLESDLNVTPTKVTKNGVFRPIGVTFNDIHGCVFWRENDTEKWELAVYHDDIRDELIAACAQEGRYLYPREAGNLPNDVTAFHKAQQNWGFERHQRPEILHQYEKAGYKNPTYRVSIWIYNGKIVLDYEGQPILAFRNMPATISTKVEGGLQEAITREDSRIDVKDFRARMMENPKGKGKRASTRPTLSAISMRRSRFRWRAGYLSWTPRTGTGDIKEYLDGLLPDACKTSNSTKGFRDLKRSEVKLMTEKNRGKHLERAGTRSVTAEKRMKMDKAFYKSIKDAKEQEKNFEVEEEQKLKIKDDEHYETDGPEDEDDESDGLEDEYSVIEDLQYYNPDVFHEFDDRLQDYRFVTPRTEAEVQIIFYSLQPTRMHFISTTKKSPRLHDQFASYAKQWVLLFRDFKEAWRETYSGEIPMPGLVQTERRAWEVGFPVIEITQHY